ncbi:pyridoxamine 5'-phosphate oxidase domain-containing protein [Hirsutella rhossiliensis]|uniref:Pyridoxamine 5'-phosphate oxidase domain-containing protein n=1 Tax=Hirsutella rhossiliensis TaxID=111463 RepID=A0A9P8N1Q1_9HYPO|nr:pyridoxamine 5'-phosphate oxidase domain-containing protein [Hirsutella rhossiliensis]KAH0964304.1 pyridoxamine 5'-phosphate oxidase domain-containing protein [Hirsutella rhossiliensis]
MKALNVAAGLFGLAGAAATPQVPLGDLVETSRIPNSSESAVMGRRILALSKLATFSTVFPHASPNSLDYYDSPETLESRPERLAGVPVGLMDYVADCEDHGNPTVLAITIGTSFQNVRAGSNLTLSMRWTPPHPPAKRISFFSRLSAYIPFLARHDESKHPHVPDTVPYSAANLPRFSLFGHLDPITALQLKAKNISECYVRKHQDARIWLPGNRIHTSQWMRYVVTDVYWIGGFGNRAYIGWIPAEEWRNVTREQWQSIKLPGEKKGWSEWSVDMAGEL